MKFCQQNKIHMISDEVYALTVYDTGIPDLPKFTSVLSIDPKGLIDVERLHVFYGMSKVVNRRPRSCKKRQLISLQDFAAAGLRLGSLISRNTLLRKSVAANMRFHGPSGMSIAIGTAILEDRAFVKRFIALSRERLTECRAFATGVLDKAGITYSGDGYGRISLGPAG